MVSIQCKNKRSRHLRTWTEVHCSPQSYHRLKTSTCSTIWRTVCSIATSRMAECMRHDSHLNRIYCFLYCSGCFGFLHTRVADQRISAIRLIVQWESKLAGVPIAVTIRSLPLTTVGTLCHVISCHIKMSYCMSVDWFVPSASWSLLHGGFSGWGTRLVVALLSLDYIESDLFNQCDILACCVWYLRNILFIWIDF